MKFVVDAHLPRGLCDLKALFDRHLPEIVAALETNSLVELDRLEVRVVI